MPDGWKNIKVVAFKRAGKWISGVVLQENDEGKRRLKLFKGRIKDDGSLEVEWKGEKFKVSMIQRFNIPSRKYWEEVKKHVESLLREIEGREAEEEEEKAVEAPLTEFLK